MAVSVKGAGSGALEREDGSLRLAPSHLRGRVTLRFRAPLAPAENLALAEALSLLEAAPALGFAASSDQAPQHAQKRRAPGTPPRLAE